MLTRRSFAQGTLLGPFMSLNVSSAFSQEQYPERQIQVVVGFPIGQSSDILARLVTKAMSHELKQTMYVDNKPGAGSIIGHQFLKAAAPDGYTIGLSSTGPLAINPTLHKKLPYEPRTDFEAIILLSITPMFLFAAVHTRVGSIRELIAYTESKNGDVTYGSGGNGATSHISMELLKKKLGKDMMHVPYKGSPPMLTDLAAGRIDFAFETMSAAGSMVGNGRIKCIGVATLERSSALPDIPTLHEQGVDGFETVGWGVLIAPKGTPQHIVNKLNAAANASLKAKEVIDYYASVSSMPGGGTPKECADLIERERRKWEPIVLASGAQID